MKTVMVKGEAGKEGENGGRLGWRERNARREGGRGEKMM